MAKNSQTNKRNYSLIFAVVFTIFILFGIFQLGVIGKTFSTILKFIFGMPYPLFGLGIVYLWFYILYKKQMPKIANNILIGSIFIIVAGLTILAAIQASGLKSVDFLTDYRTLIENDLMNGTAKTNGGGGIVGTLIYSAFSPIISNIGVWIISILGIAFGVIKLMNKSAVEVTKKIADKTNNQIRNTTQKIQETRQNKQKNDSQQLSDDSFFDREKEKADSSDDLQIKSYDQADDLSIQSNPDVDKATAAGFDDWFGTEEKVTNGNLSTSTSFPEAKPATENSIPEAETAKTIIQPSTAPSSIDRTSNSNFKSYKMPRTDLLEHITPIDQTEEKNSLKEKSQIVQDTLKNFNIDTEVSSVSLGPTVTQYELKPAPGVKVSTITNRADDLALALSAKSIRIEAPIPGKPFVGIEVPNKTQSVVSFSDVIEHSKFDSSHPLSIPLGRDVSGQVISADLAAMPHLLIAGSTGSGKSVAINGIITGILMRLKPDEVKLLMVDPKKVELSVYNGIPHLITPVVSEPRKAARALQKAVAEMEERYDLFSQNNVRNIEGWNQKVKEYNSTKGQAMHKMPYMVVIVDELADLMMTAKNDVETSIVRIAQMGRAAGIHLILATQRPSVDVITGLIKANVPSRIAFAVSSGIDSRTILDQNGAEKLLGRGDMLFAPIGKEPIRVQGAFIPDKDVINVTEFIKEQAPAEYDEKMDVENETENDDSSSTNNDVEVDELFTDARDFVIAQKKASSSLLQRRFRIGYGRAARIIDELEAAGIVGPQDGSRPREILVSEDGMPIQ